MSYRLVVRSYDDDAYEHVIAERGTEGELERMERGVNINLGDNYYTEIEKCPT